MSLLALLSALLLSFTLLSAGVSRLASPITPEQVAHERATSSSSTTTTRLTLREAVGVLDILCGVLLLVPGRSRRLGGAVALVLLGLGFVARVRREGKEGKGVGVGGKEVVCGGLCVIVVLWGV